MADSVGTDASTGAILTDWAHVEQSIAKILTTPIGARVMRRDFGSDLPDLVDRKMIQKNILAIYAAAAIAIARWEPRFRLTRARILDVAASGRLGLALSGIYYPLGHLGDYSIASDASTRVVLQGAS